MTRTIKALLGLSLASACIMCATAGPAKIKFMDTYSWGQATGGGPFEVKPMDFGFTPVGLGVNGAGPQHFLTFCVERNEYIGNHRTYHVDVNPYADNGGVSGGPQDPLDARTAFLYTAFTTGTLDDLLSHQSAVYEYGNPWDGAAMQDAVWYLEGELTQINTRAMNLVNLANAEVAEGGSWFGKGIGNVRIMNLTTASGGAAQDQLVMIPLPIPVAMGLAGIAGVGAINTWRRRRNGQIVEGDADEAITADSI